jgi:hypothetical protein
VSYIYIHILNKNFTSGRGVGWRAPAEEGTRKMCL